MKDELIIQETKLEPLIIQDAYTPEKMGEISAARTLSEYINESRIEEQENNRDLLNESECGSFVSETTYPERNLILKKLEGLLTQQL